MKYPFQALTQALPRLSHWLQASVKASTPASVIQRTLPTAWAALVFLVTLVFMQTLQAQTSGKGVIWSVDMTDAGGGLANGTVGGISYTYSPLDGMNAGVWQPSAFPSSGTNYDFGIIPVSSPSVKGIQNNLKTFSFASPITNPIILIASLGNETDLSTATFSESFEVLWKNAGMSAGTATTIGGREGNAIILFRGTFNAITMQQSLIENFANFLVGREVNATVDANDDADSGIAGSSGAINVAANDTIPTGSTYTLEPTSTCASAAVTSAGVATYNISTSGTCTVVVKVCAPSPNTTVCEISTLTVKTLPTISLTSKTATPAVFVKGGTNQKYTFTITVGGNTITAPILLTDTLATGITLSAAPTVVGGTATGVTLSSCPTSGASLAGCSIATGASTGTIIIDVPVNVGDTTTTNANTTAAISGGGDPVCTVGATDAKCKTSFTGAAPVDAAAVTDTKQPNIPSTTNIAPSNTAFNTAFPGAVYSLDTPAGATDACPSPGITAAGIASYTSPAAAQTCKVYYKLCSTGASPNPPVCDTAVLTVTGGPDPKIKVLSKVATPTVFAAGGTGSYAVTIEVTDGPTTAVINLKDTLPAGMVLTAAPSIASTPTAGPSITCSPAIVANTSTSTDGCTISSGVATGNTVVTIPVAISATVSSASGVTNTVSVTGGGDPSCPVSGALATKCSGTSAPQVVGNAADSIATPAPNISTSSNVTANNTFPTDSTYTITGGTCAGKSPTSPTTNTTGTLSYSTPASGQECTVVYTVCAPAPNSTVCDTATLTIKSVFLPADISMQKAGPSMVKNGDQVIYTLTLRNAGPGLADGAVYSDTLPAGLTGITATCDAPSSGVTCVAPTVAGNVVSGTVATLPSGGSLTITIKATAPATGSVALDNTATFNAPPGALWTDPSTTNNSSTVTTKVVPVLPKQADLSLIKSAPGSVAPNGSLSYLLTVVNAGPGAASGAVLSDTAPASLTGLAAVCVSATAGASCTAPTLAGNTMTATIATLPANASVTYKVTGTAPATAGTVITNTASITPPAGITDPTPGNNQSSASSTVFSGHTTSANVSLVKTGTSQVAVDGTVTYTLVVSNAGPAAADGIQVTDALSAELSNITTSCSPTSGGPVCGANTMVGNTLTATITTLPVNSSVTYTITAKAPALPARLTNTAKLTLPAGIIDPSPEDNIGGPVITQVSGSGAIKGNLYRDTNRNGKRDASETAVPGVTVTLRNAAGVVVATTTTDASGNYTFSGLPAGTGYSATFSFDTLPRGLTNVDGTAVDPLSGNPSGLSTITGITVLDDNVTLNQNARIVDPSGVVYDSLSRQPITGATVCLFANGALVSNSQLTAATPNCQVTDTNGAYAFFINATAPVGTYSLQVTPPSGYLAPNATVGGVPLPTVGGVCAIPPAPGVVKVYPLDTAPALGVNGAAAQYCLEITGFGPAAQDVIHNHIPLDAIANAKLVVTKTAAKPSVELGDSITYTVTVRRVDTDRGILSTFAIIDTLPAGFTYIPGTAALNGVSVTDASIGLAGQGAKPAMRMTLNAALKAGQTHVLTYRVRVGVGALEGNATNRASAQDKLSTNCAAEPAKCSNEARFTVKVGAGVFTTEACVVGKVYADCNRNQVQDNGELGIPGVRVVTLDGTQITTDAQGQYSLCGLKPQTNVFKVDRTSLPKGAVLGISANRNAGEAGSLFVDLKKGELHRADFLEHSCSPEVMENIKIRRAQAQPMTVEGGNGGFKQ